MFCAGYRDGRSDTCSGDSGGPLLCNIHGRWTVVGVTSFGYGCGRHSKYGIYANVANHVRWITSVIKTSGYQWSDDDFQKKYLKQPLMIVTCLLLFICILLSVIISMMFFIKKIIYFIHYNIMYIVWTTVEWDTIKI